MIVSLSKSLIFDATNQNAPSAAALKYCSTWLIADKWETVDSAPEKSGLIVKRRMMLSAMMTISLIIAAMTVFLATFDFIALTADSKASLSCACGSAFSDSTRSIADSLSSSPAWLLVDDEIPFEELDVDCWNSLFPSPPSVSWSFCPFNLMAFLMLMSPFVLTMPFLR